MTEFVLLTRPLGVGGGYRALRDRKLNLHTVVAKDRFEAIRSVFDDIPDNYLHQGRGEIGNSVTHAGSEFVAQTLDEYFSPGDNNA